MTLDMAMKEEKNIFGFLDNSEHKIVKSDQLKELTYEGFNGGDYEVESNGLITGEVLNCGKSLIMFQGFNQEELKASFIESIDSYLSLNK